MFTYALATLLLGGPKSLGYLRRLARQAHHLRRSFAISPEIRLHDHFLVLAHLGFEQRPCKSEKASPPGAAAAAWRATLPPLQHRLANLQLQLKALSFV